MLRGPPPACRKGRVCAGSGTAHSLRLPREMKLAAIALDYDGTIAVNDVMDASVRTAIAAARDAQAIDDVMRAGHQVRIVSVMCGPGAPGRRGFRIHSRAL